MSVYDQITNSELKRAYSYVMSIRRPGMLPAKSSLDPIKMKDWLANIELIDVLDGGANFQYRVAGSVIEDIFHRRMHRKNLDNIFSGNVLDFKKTIFTRCAKERKVILSNGNLERNSTNLASFERILIPMSENGEIVDTLFGCTLARLKTQLPPEYDNSELKIISEIFVEEQV